MEMIIYWNNFAKGSYAQGGQTRFEGRTVYFENALMSPSLVIKTWTSLTNYQAGRTQPDLPFLRRGQDYRLRLEAESQPFQTLYVRVEFFDRFRESLGFELLKQDELVFTYPDQAYSYDIQLINAGCRSFVFHQLLLESVELSDTENHKEAITILNEAKGAPVHLIFSEKDDVTDLPQIILEQLSNIIFIHDKASLEACYLDSDMQKKIRKLLSQCPNKSRHLIAYGPRGNFAVAFYQERYPEWVGHVTSHHWRPEDYLTSSPVLAELTPFIVEHTVKKIQGSPDLCPYGSVIERPELTFVGSLFTGVQQLEQLPILEDKDRKCVE